MDILACDFCRAPLHAGDKILQVWIVEEVRNGLPWVRGEPVPAHAKCENPLATWTGAYHSLAKLKPEANVKPIQEKAPSHQCLFCHQVWRRGDRLVVVYQVEGMARDPRNGAPGTQCSVETEYAHKDCADRDASKGAAGGIIFA